MHHHFDDRDAAMAFRSGADKFHPLEDTNTAVV